MNGELPLISVGMAVFNSAKTLRRQIESVLNQTYAKLEIIMTDDCSTDGSREICREYAARDRRIKLVLREKNVGFIRNYNSVVQAATGEFFFWADGDDYHYPEYAATLVRELRARPDAVIAAPAFHLVYEDGEEYKFIRFSGRLAPCRMSAYRRLHMLLTSRSELRDMKYNLFSYGLIRTAPLQQLMKDYDWPQGERGLVAELALEHKLTAVDQVLVQRNVKRRPPVEHYPDEEYLKRPAQSQLEKYTCLWNILSRSPFGRKPVTRFWTLPRLAVTIALEGKVRREIKKRLRDKARGLFRRG